jgi:hypothetical protein
MQLCILILANETFQGVTSRRIILGAESLGGSDQSLWNLEEVEGSECEGTLGKAARSSGATPGAFRRSS